MLSKKWRSLLENAHLLTSHEEYFVAAFAKAVIPALKIHIKNIERGYNYRVERLARWKSNGLCIDCGVETDVNKRTGKYHVHCKSCRIRRTRYAKNYRKKIRKQGILRPTPESIIIAQQEVP